MNRAEIKNMVEKRKRKKKNMVNTKNTREILS